MYSKYACAVYLVGNIQKTTHRLQRVFKSLLLWATGTSTNACIPRLWNTLTRYFQSRPFRCVPLWALIQEPLGLHIYVLSSPHISARSSKTFGFEKIGSENHPRAGPILRVIRHCGRKYKSRLDMSMKVERSLYLRPETNTVGGPACLIRGTGTWYIP